MTESGWSAEACPLPQQRQITCDQTVSLGRRLPESTGYVDNDLRLSSARMV